MSSGQSRRGFLPCGEEHDRPLAHSHRTDAATGRSTRVRSGVPAPACHDRRAMSQPPSPPPALPLGSDGYPAAGGVARRVGRRRGVRAGQPPVVGRSRPGLPDRARRRPGRRRLPLVSGGHARRRCAPAGRVEGRRVLEIGCGSARCARWLRRAGADVVALDVSAGMLARAAELNGSTGVAVPLLQGRRRRPAVGRVREHRRRVLGVRRVSRSSPTRGRSSPRSRACCGRAGGSSPR